MNKLKAEYRSGTQQQLTDYLNENDADNWILISTTYTGIANAESGYSIFLFTWAKGCTCAVQD